MAFGPDQISDDQKREALQRVLADPRLDGADRLKGFLSYIVDEDIAGRGEAIRGKTIAQDVYGRDTSEGTDPENVVRVDARRLRQALELYYQTDGQADPVRLHLDSGGYHPRFERVSSAEPGKNMQSWPRFLVPATAFAVGGVIGAVLSSFVAINPRDDPLPVAVAPPVDDGTSELQRVSIYEKSPAALQAFNLSHQARAMLFPIFDRPRQELVLSVFERVIDLDPDYFGGYAGAAQTLATLSVLSPPSQAKTDTAQAAMTMAEAAVRLAPGEAWSQSAKSWAAFAEGDYETADRLSHRAALIDPDDTLVLDFLGAVSLFTGDFDEAVRTAEREELNALGNQRFARRNISGAANFHLGNYALTVKRFEEAAEFGDPLSAPSLAYQTAALNLLGRERQARAKLEELERGWPAAPVDAMLRSIHSDDAYANEVIAQLEELGWQGSSVPNVK